MANCVNCGKKIGMFNAVSKWNFNDKTMCLDCTNRFSNLLAKNNIGWESDEITWEFIDKHQEELRLSPAGVAFLRDYVDYVQRTNPHDPEQRAELERQMAERERIQEQETQEKRQALAGMLISSGFNFEGYRIVKYSGYISGDDAVQIPRSGLFDRGQNGKNLTDALVRIRRQALKELKEAAYDLGCNAVIGVDFDYITLDPETATITGGTFYEPYVICVTANGNAVVIEKIED